MKNERENLFQVHDGIRHLSYPIMFARWTALPHSVVTIHNRLQNTCERSHADPSCDQNSVLSPENVARRSPIRAVNSHLHNQFLVIQFKTNIDLNKLWNQYTSTACSRRKFSDLGWEFLRLILVVEELSTCKRSDTLKISLLLELIGLAVAKVSGA